MRPFRLAGVGVVIAACGGGDGTSPPPPQVTSVVITSPTSAQSIAACGTVNFAAQARDNQGNAVANATINWTSSVASAVSLSSATGTATTATGVGVGSSDVRATSGTLSSNPISVTVGAGGTSGSADVTATASSTFSPSCVNISAGGTVTWTFVPTPSHNVIFGTNKPTGGDIGTTQNTTVSRTFPIAGSYPYVCNLHQGMTGVVVVQ